MDFYNMSEIQKSMKEEVIRKNRRYIRIMIMAIAAALLLAVLLVAHYYVTKKLGMLDYIMVGGIVAFALVAFLSNVIRNRAKMRKAGVASKKVEKMLAIELSRKMIDQGFYDVVLKPVEDLEPDDTEAEGQVIAMTIGGDGDFGARDTFNCGEKVEITYHALSRIYAPMTAGEAKNMNYQRVMNAFEMAGFVNVKAEPVYDIKLGLMVNENQVKTLTVDGKSNYNAKTGFRYDVPVAITYHAKGKGRKQDGMNENAVDASAYPGEAGFSDEDVLHEAMDEM